MAIERSLILCKGDAVVRGLVGEIVGRYERRGLMIVGMKMMLVDEARAKRHYGEHEGKPFFEGLVKYITSTPIVALVVEGHDAIEICRTTNGATNPVKAAAGTIRGDYGQTVGRNLVHASDSPENGEREIAIFFEKNELYPRKHALQQWLTED